MRSPTADDANAILLRQPTLLFTCLYPPDALGKVSVGEAFEPGDKEAGS
jgi:hypothetical protein